MKIGVLPDHVINHIAAGEVVERPASVVRELVDNAVDSGSRRISVYLEDGGISLIRVVDDGCGMTREDALLACERHATSKIRDVNDLDNIHTLGFRGEALSSIAAVSRLRLKSRSSSDPAAVELTIVGGSLKDVNTVSGPPGTDIQAATLFFNVPARKKFLRQPATEERRVKQWLTQSAIVSPHIHYQLHTDGKLLLNLPACASPIERARGIFKGEVVSFEESWGRFTLQGLLCHPSLAQADTSALVLFVNGRLVSDRLLLKAVREGFQSTLKGSEYPAGFVSLSLPPEDVDVNVHPQKSEVRFRAGNEVFAAVRQVVLRHTNAFTGPLQPVWTAPGKPEHAAEPRPEPIPLAFSSPRAEPRPGTSVPPAELNAIPEEVPVRAEPFRFSELRYIGQALACYLFCEKDGVLYVVDMHAAHERYNYNLIRNGMRTRAVESQLLLAPLAVALSETGAHNCLEHQELLSACGFEVEPFGESTVLVRSVPAVLADSDPAPLIKEIAALELGAGPQGSVEALIDQIAARIACHASVRSGYRIEKEEAYALFAALDQSEFSSACPHGRPVVVSFRERDIERWFGRDR